MKKLIFSLTISLVAFAGYNATAQLTPGPFRFSATVEAQGLESGPTTTNIVSTNKTTTNSTYITTADYTLAKSFTLSDNSLLVLLGNSLSTTFPPGSKLVIDDGYGISVSYKGTNTSVSSVLTISPELILYSGKEKITYATTTKGTNATTKVSGGQALTETIAGKLTYDDSALGLATTNTFHVYGIAKAAYDFVDGLTSGTTKGNFIVTGGVGTGIISNTPSILSGVSISGSYTVTGD